MGLRSSGPRRSPKPSTMVLPQVSWRKCGLTNKREAAHSTYLLLIDGSATSLVMPGTKTDGREATQTSTSPLEKTLNQRLFPPASGPNSTLSVPHGTVPAQPRREKKMLGGFLRGISEGDRRGGSRRNPGPSLQLAGVRRHTGRHAQTWHSRCSH